MRKLTCIYVLPLIMVAFGGSVASADQVLRSSGIKPFIKLESTAKIENLFGVPPQMVKTPINPVFQYIKEVGKPGKWLDSVRYEAPKIEKIVRFWQTTPRVAEVTASKIDTYLSAFPESIREELKTGDYSKSTVLETITADGATYSISSISPDDVLSTWEGIYHGELEYSEMQFAFQRGIGFKRAAREREYMTVQHTGWNVSYMGQSVERGLQCDAEIAERAYKDLVEERTAEANRPDIREHTRDTLPAKLATWRKQVDGQQKFCAFLSEQGIR